MSPIPVPATAPTAVALSEAFQFNTELRSDKLSRLDYQIHDRAFRRLRLASWCDGDHSQRTAGAADDFQWRGDHDGAGGRKLIKVRQAGQPKLAAAVHQIVVREGWVKSGGLTGIGPDRFYPDPQHIPIVG